MKRTSRSANRAYPSIMELALRTGKWTVVAGGAALVMGASGCEEVNGLTDDTESVQVDGMPYVEDVTSGDPDIPDAVDAGHDVWFNEGIAIPDEVWPDAIGDADAVEVYQEPDAGWTEGLPSFDEVYQDVSDVIAPGDVIDAGQDDPGLTGEDVLSHDADAAVTDDADLPAADADVTDPGVPLPGEAPADVTDPGEVIAADAT